MSDNPMPGEIGPGDETSFFRVYDGWEWINQGHCVLSEEAVLDLMKRQDAPARVMPDGTCKPCWALKLVEVREEEIQGLTRPEFRALVRAKLQVVGDDLLKEWEDMNGS
jgi:hypothetical protein